MFAKKSLGQHFLKDPRALLRIADAAQIAPTDVVLEVGPGEGALTALILERAGRVVAVEKDARLIPHLQQHFSSEISSGKLMLVHGDILAFSTTDPDAPTFVSEVGTPTASRRGYKLVANLPYYITGAFLKKFLQSEEQPASMTLLLQKEVAERIVARDSKESILSVSVKCYGTPRIIGVVKAGAFSPPPKVDSAILAIEDISKDFFNTPPYLSQNPPPRLIGGQAAPSFMNYQEYLKKEGARGWISETHFFALVKKGFAHPRKLLASNLGIKKETLAQCGIAENARPGDVSFTEWRCLAETLGSDARQAGI